MHYYRPAPADMLATLPPAERDELIALLILGPQYVPAPEHDHDGRAARIRAALAR